MKTLGYPHNYLLLGILAGNNTVCVWLTLMCGYLNGSTPNYVLFNYISNLAHKDN